MWANKISTFYNLEMVSYGPVVSAKTLTLGNISLSKVQIFSFLFLNSHSQSSDLYSCTVFQTVRRSELDQTHCEIGARFFFTEKKGDALRAS